MSDGTHPTPDPAETADIGDVVALLRAADPVTSEQLDRLRTEPAPAALFQEITMHSIDHEPTTFDAPVDVDYVGAPAALSARRRRPRWYLPAAAAAAAAVVVAAIAALPGASRPASAAVVAAAERTAAAASGTVEVRIDIATGPQTGNLVLTTRYSGGDVELAFTGKMGEPPATTGAGSTHVDAVIRVVGGKTYVRSPDLGQGWLTGAASGSAMEMLRTIGLPATPDPSNKGLVDLVRSADHVRRIGPGHYQAQVTVAELRALPDLPAGIAMVVRPDATSPSAPAAAGDAVLALDLTIDSADNLNKVVVSFDAITAPGDSAPSSGSITTSYRDLGSPISIEVPNDVTNLATPTMTPAMTAAIDTLAELEKRRPQLCADALAMPQDASASVADAATPYLDCLEAAGEHAAAAAYQTVIAATADQLAGSTTSTTTG